MGIKLKEEVIASISEKIGQKFETSQSFNVTCRVEKSLNPMILLEHWQWKYINMKLSWGIENMSLQYQILKIFTGFTEEATVQKVEVFDIKVNTFEPIKI